MSGEAVNPDGVANQFEGGAIHGTSVALLEEVRFDRRRVTSDNWEGYPILRFSEVPKVDGRHHRPARPALPRRRRGQHGADHRRHRRRHHRCARHPRRARLPFTPDNLAKADA